MLSLLIETATERSVVAIAKEGNLLYRYDLPMGFNNSKLLLPHVEQALHHAKITVADLDLIISGIGPGSYTGMRVGAITAKTLSYASMVPLVGVCSLKGFVPTVDGPFAAIIDAKIGGAYILKGNKIGGQVTFDDKPVACELELLGEFLSGVTLLVTPNKQVLEGKITLLYPDHPWKWEERAPEPLVMSHFAEAAFQKGEHTIDGKLELLYLRKTQAEIERQNKS